MSSITIFASTSHKKTNFTEFQKYFKIFLSKCAWRIFFCFFNSARFVPTSSELIYFCSILLLTINGGLYKRGGVSQERGYLHYTIEHNYKSWLHVALCLRLWPIRNANFIKITASNGNRPFAQPLGAPATAYWGAIRRCGRHGNLHERRPRSLSFEKLGQMHTECGKVLLGSLGVMNVKALGVASV